MNNKYFLFSCYLLLPLILGNGSFKPTEFVFGNTLNGNQAELHINDSQKKTENPTVDINATKYSHNEEKKSSTKKKKVTSNPMKKKKKDISLTSLDELVFQIESKATFIDDSNKHSILGEILLNLSGSVLYGEKVYISK
ncbi:TPA: hypothetical protein ACN1ND_000266 [Enterococcus faecalis]|nr:hypothetical protein [Enterococcus faecalis]EKQ3613723.1 hypothetical protein [Enterococcus faecalis]